MVIKTYKWLQKALYRPPKPSAAGSSPVSPARYPKPSKVWDFLLKRPLLTLCRHLEMDRMSSICC